MDENEKKSKLLAIFENDTLGLLSTDDKQKTPRSPLEDRLIDSFYEISEFYEANHREPQLSEDIVEFRLASRLASIRKDPKKVKLLLPYDYYNLLKQEETKSVSLEDLVADDPLGLLDVPGDDNSIFTMSHVKPSERIRPDYIARRKVCKDFDDYKTLFDSMHAELESGKRHLKPFKTEDLQEGRFYVLRGVMFYMAINSAELTEKTYAGELYRRKDGRTRCIFDNGTESTMLFRSLVKAMQHDGFSISDIESEFVNPDITKEDVQCGYIYVLRSLSRNPQIRQMKDLYKIGYCSGDVTTRIKNARHEPTYLMSDVEIVLTVRCYNLDVPFLESSIHTFFKDVNIYFEISDDQGSLHYPKEWFQAPLKVIEEAIQLIVNKRIEEYKYNPTLRMIVKVEA